MMYQNVTQRITVRPTQGSPTLLSPTCPVSQNVTPKITVRPRIGPLAIGFVTWWHPPGMYTKCRPAPSLKNYCHWHKLKFPYCQTRTSCWVQLGSNSFVQGWAKERALGCMISPPRPEEAMRRNSRDQGPTLSPSPALCHVRNGCDIRLSSPVDAHIFSVEK